MIILAAPRVLPPEIIASPGPVLNEETITKKQVVQQSMTKFLAPSTSMMSTITSNVATTMSIPSLDFQTAEAPVELGSTFGAGMAFGAVGAAGGNISFMGNSGSGSRVVFAVDFSKSMGSWNGEHKPITEVQQAVKAGGKVPKHYILRNELYTALKKRPQGTQYQGVQFSGSAWAHDVVEQDWLNDPAFYDQGATLKRRLSDGGHNSNVSKDYFPPFSYLTANPANIARSCEVVEKIPTSNGTNWENPVLMALSITPKPDIIFFMTDGSVKDPTMALQLVREANSKGGKKTIIHTTAMMAPKAARDMATLAAENGGDFTIVMEGGKIVKGEEFFKNNP